MLNYQNGLIFTAQSSSTSDINLITSDPNCNISFPNRLHHVTRFHLITPLPFSHLQPLASKTTSPNQRMRLLLASPLHLKPTRSNLIFEVPTRAIKPSKHLFRSPHTTRKMSTTNQPTFSSNYDPSIGIKDVQPLLRSHGGKWILIESGKGVERSFKFKTFKKTWVCIFPKLHSELI